MVLGAVHSSLLACCAAGTCWMVQKQVFTNRAADLLPICCPDLVIRPTQHQVPRVNISVICGGAGLWTELNDLVTYV
jgi:hypothetical protein